MLLIMVCTVYHDGFFGGVIVFDRVGQLSELAVWHKVNKKLNIVI